MKTFQQVLSSEDLNFSIPFKPDVCLVFASRYLLENDHHLSVLRERFSDVIFFGCSTSGEISNSGISDETFNLTAIQFEGNTRVKSLNLLFLLIKVA